jgi:hypothetical protein
MSDNKSALSKDDKISLVANAMASIVEADETLDSLNEDDLCGMRLHLTLAIKSGVELLVRINES